MRQLSACAGALIVSMLICASASAQEAASDDTRAQYPPFLNNSYFSINVGSIRYLFSGQQLAPGYAVESIDIPHLAVRVDLFGHRFTKHLSAQATYMRPARYVMYRSVNGDKEDRRISAAY